MTFGTTKDKPWVEALPVAPHLFTGRTFSRHHIVGTRPGVPTVGEIWASPDHVVVPHAHDSDELLYVLSGSIEIDGRRLSANDVVFIPRGTAYDARVVGPDGSRVLRVALPGAVLAPDAEDQPRIWQGALTDEGVPDLTADS